VSEQAHFEELARRGNATAIAWLEGPEMPEALTPLWRRFLALDASRGVNEAGLMPLTYPDVRAYAALTDWQPEPHEADALMELDRAIRFPEAGKDADA